MLQVRPNTIYEHLNVFLSTCTLKLCEGYFPDYDPEQIMGDGDGTVNIRFVANTNSLDVLHVAFYVKM